MPFAHRGPSIESAGAAFLFDAEDLDDLLIRGVGQLVMPEGGASVAHTVTVEPTAKFNMGNHTLVVDYTGPTPGPDLIADLTLGHAGGTWEGPGIFTTVAASVAGSGLGYAEAAELFALPDVDGALVGGASLKPDDFAEIVRLLDGPSRSTP